MSAYIRRKAPLLAVILTAINTWQDDMTPAQRRDLLAAPCDMHPRVRARLYEMRLIRKDGRRTVWGDRVVDFATRKPNASKETP